MQAGCVMRRRSEIEGIPIYYQTAGCGEPVILLHGLCGSSRWWRRNIRPLAARLHVYAIDLVGFGASKHHERLSLREFARLLAAWMGQLGLERAHIVGHSMGGLIAADLAADFAERVDRLVLVDAAFLPPGTSVWRQAPGLLRALPRLPASFWPVLVSDALRAGSLTVWHMARELLSTDLRPKLGHIQAPTLLIWGARDTLTPPGIARMLQAELRNPPLLLIERAGHNPMWDRPEQFNRAVLEFLAAR